MSIGRHAEDVFSINVGGKKYTVCRTDLLADPRSKLAEWFKPGRPMPTDKGGSVFLNRDGKSFRHILMYLRIKKDRSGPPFLALPSKPDDLAKLVAESDALNLLELKDLALELLEKYRRAEEQHFTDSYVQLLVRDIDGWKFERERSKMPKSKSNTALQTANYDSWGKFG